MILTSISGDSVSRIVSPCESSSTETRSRTDVRPMIPQPSTNQVFDRACKKEPGATLDALSKVCPVKPLLPTDVRFQLGLQIRPTLGCAATHRWQHKVQIGSDVALPARL